jgi:hypothetical protein
MAAAADKAQYEADGFLVVRGLLAGAELDALIRLTDKTLDGEIKPVSDYKGWLPPDFYTHWEPGYE